MTNVRTSLRAALAGLALAAGQTALAQPAVTLDSAVFVERETPDARVLERAARLAPGDRIVTVLTWRRNGAGGFTLTNPLPRGIYYQGSADGGEDVSVDGGKTWGKLGSLRIGSRFATPEDVTHVRWRIASPAPTGRIAYSAIVR